jgi:hypothetical protein
LTGGTGASEVGPVFINAAITVVVFSITDLGFWSGSAAIDPLTGATDLHAIATGRFAGASQAVVYLAVAIVIEIVAGFLCGDGCDGFHGGVEFGGVAGLIILTRARASGSTFDRHLVETIGIDTRAKADDVGLDVQLCTETADILICTGGLTIGDKQVSVFAVTHRVRVFYSGEMVLRSPYCGDQVGPAIRVQTTKDILEIGDAGCSVGDALVESIIHAGRAAEGRKTKAQFAFVGGGDGIDGIDSSLPVATIVVAHTS